MNKRQITTKLVLHKKTVSNLNSIDQRQVNGGNKTGITCMRLCDTIDFSCAVTNCVTCQQSCNFSECYSECIC